jgi:hypothetical protein
MVEREVEKKIVGDKVLRVVELWDPNKMTHARVYEL